MTIQVRAVSMDDWFACTQLQVSEKQKSTFPAPVVYWLAESRFVTDFQPMAIYNDSDLVGFAVYSDQEHDEGDYWLPALMIDHKYQGRGYGKEALQALIYRMQKTLNCKRILIGHRPDNHVAGALYESLGFQQISEELIDGEVVRALTFGTKSD
ncbi:GNAT family N-acetyltransferase [Paenibacillus xylanexedens]|uniref:GNAT family N-acetyltransferase n=1 Tax=Paenibacillus xylanexedens TaxID=528191 RepID=UPI0011AA8713|nr:GNAT family N-acetyltransferase [Paenibacillus xylanexedens]